MGSVNKVIILGRLGADPEVRSTNNGSKVVNLRVACSEQWRDKSSGEKRERTEWVRVTIFNERHAGVAEAYLKKGSPVYLEGQLQTREYTDQQGVKKYSTEVVLQNFRGELTLLDSKGSDDRDTGAMPYEVGSERDPNAPPKRSISERAAPGAQEYDSEVPF